MGEFIWNVIFWGFIYVFIVRPIAQRYVQMNPNASHFVYILADPVKELKKYTSAQFGLQPKTASYTQTRNNLSSNFMNNMNGKILWIVGGVLLIIFLMNAIVVIPAGSTGVRTLFGKVKDKEISSGLHIINPLEHIERMTIRTEEYTMSVMQGEGQRVGADQIAALTNEGLSIDLDITVFYHLQEDRASDVYKDLGVNFQEKIIRPEIRSAIREVIAHYNAKDVYSEKRAEVSSEIQKRMIETIEPRGIGIEQVLLRNVTLPPKLSASIQEKLQAEQESQRYEFVLEKEKKEAERKRVEAEGQRDAQAIINESLTPKYLEYLYIKELKDRAGTIYVPVGNDGLPLFKSVE
ncbi:MAG: band 7 protein [Candidatus Moraniibacteriota bacterium]|nr:MAG: band 7 protein [Candidatus Moranbacteria bacterium]